MVFEEKRKGLVFGDLAVDYAAARPEYPDRLFEAIAAGSNVPPKNALVLDVGAGTGAATKQLVTRYGGVIAVEPSRPMLAQAAIRVDGSAAWRGGVQGFAEALPIRGGAVDLVAVAQAFHWMEHDLALGEFARVLRSRGRLALLFHTEGVTDFEGEVWELVEDVNPGHKRPVTVEMRDPPHALLSHAGFRGVESTDISWSRAMPVDQYVKYAFSWSYVGGVLEPHERAPFERRLREIVARHFGAGEVIDEHVSVVHLAQRV